MIQGHFSYANVVFSFARAPLIYDFFLGGELSFVYLSWYKEDYCKRNLLIV